MFFEESSDFYVQSDPHRLFVEGWTAWHLPFMRLTPSQKRYRECLRTSIKGLATTGGVRATYTSDKITRNLDTENVLFDGLTGRPQAYTGPPQARLSDVARHRRLALLPVSVFWPYAIEQVVTAPRSPWQNAYVERIIGSIRRECLYHVVIFDERHLRRVLSSYFRYYHQTRTHLSLGKDCPESRPIHLPAAGKIIPFPQVGGLHHRYERRAA